MVLRPGSDGSNTFTDHKEVLTDALNQVPVGFRRKILVRIDGVGASHILVGHLISLSTARKTVLCTCGWTILDADEQAIAALPLCQRMGTRAAPGPQHREGQGHGRDHASHEPGRRPAARDVSSGSTRTGPGLAPSSPAGTGSAPCPRQPDQRKRS